MASPAPTSDPPLPGLPAACAAMPRRRRFAAAWTPDERQFAASARAAWNEAFKGKSHGHGASDVRHNDFAAILFHRRNEARPAAERYTLADVCAAIAGYAADPMHFKSYVFCYFANWFAAAEDRIDHQLRRLGRKRGNQGPNPESPDARLAARLLRDYAGVVRFFERAASNSMPPLEYAKAYRALLRRPGELAKHDRFASNLMCFDALPLNQRKDLRIHARRLFEARFNRDPFEHLKDEPALCALAFALFHQESLKESPHDPT